LDFGFISSECGEKRDLIINVIITVDVNKYKKYGYEIMK